MKFFLVVALLVGGGIIVITTMTPGPGDLPGNFREVDAYQNENNTGPVNRVYIVTLSDTLWNEMEAYGEYMPYTKLGTTNVWFFLEDQPFPNQITPGDVPFPPVYKKACVGRYAKNNVGAVQLIKRPFQ